MTTSCCADGDFSGATPSSKQRCCSPNRIKLSRELMIKLTAAAAALSNNGGGGDRDERVQDVRNGSQVMLSNGTFAHLSSSTSNLRECKSQPTSGSNDKPGEDTTNEEALLTERRGNIRNTCDNNLDKNSQLQTSWPLSLLQQQTSPSTPSQLSASDLVKTSSMKNDCSSISAALVGASSSSATADSLPILNQCDTRPAQQQQHNSMPIRNNNQPRAQPMRIRSGAIKHCSDDDDGGSESATAVTKTGTVCCSIATIDDNDIDKGRATSIEGGKPLVSDAGEFSCSSYVMIAIIA